MAAKILGQVDLTTTGATLVGAAVPANLQWAFTVIFCNRTSFLVKIRLALAATTTPTNAEWIWYDIELAPNETRDFAGLALQASKNVIAQADTANAVSVTALGIEEPVIN